MSENKVGYRIDTILGRTDDMVKVKGVNIFLQSLTKESNSATIDVYYKILFVKFCRIIGSKINFYYLWTVRR